MIITYAQFVRHGYPMKKAVMSCHAHTRGQEKIGVGFGQAQSLYFLYNDQPMYLKPL